MVAHAILPQFLVNGFRMLHPLPVTALTPPLPILAAADLRHWTAPALAFNRTLTRTARFPSFLFPAGIPTADRLERPQLLFDAQGKLTHGFFGMKLNNATPSMNAVLLFEAL